MINCDNISIVSADSEKVYLHGIITGLDASKEYCIKYDEDGHGSWVNAPNKIHNYTYMINTTSVDIGGYGVYVYRDPRYTTYAIRLFEVSGSCEKIVASKCNRYLSIPDDTPGTYKNIPPEIVVVMPTGTTRIVAIPLKPLSWANFNGLRSHLSPIVDIVARTITIGGYIGWRSLGVDVVKLSNGEIHMVVFLGGA
jgi:hypothetical protein